MRRVLPGIALAALSALVTPAALAADQPVSVVDNSFLPGTVAVKPGDSVTWNAAGAFNPHNVTFEDGQLTDPSPAAPGPWTTSRTFPSSGVYRYYCQIHGGSGGFGMSGVVHVNAAGNLPPVAVLGASPNPAQVGQTVTFTAAGTSDPDGTIAKYEWDLDGNGSFEADTLTTPTAARSYASAGTLNVKLRVTDEDQGSAEAARSLRVDPLPAAPAAGTTPLPAPAVAAASTLLPPSFASAKKAITVSRSGRFSYGFRAAPGLAGTITFTSAARVQVAARRQISLGTRRFSVPTSGIATVRVKLSRRNLRALRRNRRIRFRVGVTLRNAAGSSSSGSTTVTLRSPR